jgi:hypothetical protein
MVELIEPIICGYFVALGEGRKIEDVIHEELGITAEGHHRLPDVYQLGGSGADHVNAQDFVRLLVNEHFKHT